MRLHPATCTVLTGPAVGEAYAIHQNIILQSTGTCCGKSSNLAAMEGAVVESTTGVRQRKGGKSKKAAKPAKQSVAAGPKPEKEPNKLIENSITAGGWRRRLAAAGGTTTACLCYTAASSRTILHPRPHLQPIYCCWSS